MFDKNKVYISGSLSCIDLLNIEEQMKEIEESDISLLHYDVVDGIFSDCFCFGDLLLEKIRPLTKKPICVHLAVFDVEKYLNPFINRGADYIIVHYEGNCNLKETFKKIRKLGAKPALAIRCDTKIPKDFIDLAKECDFILKHTVLPGYSGQPIRMEALEEVKLMRKILNENGMEDKLIETDGNMSLINVPIAAEFGANIFTGGTSGLFNKNGTIKENAVKMIEVAKEGLKRRC